MKKSIKIFLLVLVAGCSYLMVSCTNSPPPAELISKRPYKGVELLTVHSPAIADNLIGDTSKRYVTVYLPPDYHSSDRSYPVVYFLHGYTYSVFQMVDCAPEVLNKHFKTHQEDAFIMVGIDGHNTYAGSFWANSPITGNWADHVVKEIPALINTNYRTKTGLIVTRPVVSYPAGAISFISTMLNFSITPAATRLGRPSTVYPFQSLYKDAAPVGRSAGAV